ncbi:MAG: TatD family hydrolase [Aggregatilineales bacterium]
MLIDTHCHLNLEAFDADRDAVLNRAAESGVTCVINPAFDLESGATALKLTVQYPGMFASVGIHPNSTAQFRPGDIEQIENQARSSPKVVAIGEIGLDYHWDDSPKDVQRVAFEAQLVLAARLELPVIIHNREASDDVIAVLRAWLPMLPESLRARPGVLHSFSAPSEIADQALAMGFYLGFTGPITYKKSDELRAIAARVPANRLLVETDAPYLTPQAHRGQRNEPAYVRYVAERLAALRNVPGSELAAQTTANAERLFALPLPKTPKPDEE